MLTYHHVFPGWLEMSFLEFVCCCLLNQQSYCTSHPGQHHHRCHPAFKLWRWCPACKSSCYSAFQTVPRINQLHHWCGCGRRMRSRAPSSKRKSVLVLFSPWLSPASLPGCPKDTRLSQWLLCLSLPRLAQLGTTRAGKPREFPDPRQPAQCPQPVNKHCSRFM